MQAATRHSIADELNVKFAFTSMPRFHAEVSVAWHAFAAESAWHDSACINTHLIIIINYVFYNFVKYK